MAVRVAINGFGRIRSSCIQTDVRCRRIRSSSNQRFNKPKMLAHLLKI